MILEQMANELGLPVEFVHSIARGASHEYKQYRIPKRTTGYRVIHHPSRRLKALQRWLLANVVERLPVHSAAMAYRKRRSIFDNARLHADSRYLLRMDLEQFFPSITAEDLIEYIKQHQSLFPEWIAADVNDFCALVCRESRLTIGAPTSPSLANAICYDLDHQLHALSEHNGVVYSRYADDLFFSTSRQNVLFNMETSVAKVVADLNLPRNLRINSGKTRHSSRRGARRVTGIVLGSDGAPHVGRNLKRKIRAMVCGLDTLDEPQRVSLAGLIAYATGFEPDFLNKLIDKYGLSRVNMAMKPHSKIN